MKQYPEEETYKELYIPVADASAYPRTVVIMLLDANSTRCAMKRSRRSYYLASFAISECIVSLLLINDIFITLSAL